MPTDALVIAPAILAVVLVVSAVGKLRSPAHSSQAFTALEVPRRLASPLVVKALPWVEIVLALALVVAGGWLGLVVSLAVLALFCAYLALIVRARGFETDVDCACFGSVGPGRITTLTVWRNVWLVALAVASVLVATSGDALLSRLSEGTAPWEWLLAAAAAALTVLLVVGTGAESNADAPTVTVGDFALEEGDYVRSRTPAVAVTLGDGSRTDLRRLSASRAQLLLYVSEGCGSCTEIIAAVPGWRTEMSEVDVRLMVAAEPQASRLTSASEPMSTHDSGLLVWDTFGIQGTPAALLLGADGLLAGGPVLGGPAVHDFVADIRSELQSAKGELSTW